jgi:uncharacterized C2H2 Zn-finger protein
MKPLGCECSDCPRCNGTINKLELIAEDLERAHLWLDDKGVPRHDEATEATFSLVGRIIRYKDT